MTRKLLIAASALVAVSCGPTVAPDEELGSTHQGLCGYANQPPCGGSVSNQPAPHNQCQTHLYLSSTSGTCETCGVGCSGTWCSWPYWTPPCPFPVSNNPSPHNGCDTGAYVSGNVCYSCGEAGEAACPYSLAPYTQSGCKWGTGNYGGSCSTCGMDNQPACPYALNNTFPSPHNQCYGGFMNVGGVCHACGGAGQPVCPYLISWNQDPDGYCNSNLVNVNGTCVNGPVTNTIGYGQMGRRDGGHADVCASGLTPHNVDSRYSNYPQAPDGWFSCWYNSPDVICHTVPQLYNYINVRRCYQPPGGGPTVYYGCDTCP
jgi:hypothetical protein